jgi:hypothetical protein
VVYWPEPRGCGLPVLYKLPKLLDHIVGGGGLRRRYGDGEGIGSRDEQPGEGRNLTRRALPASPFNPCVSEMTR